MGTQVEGWNTGKVFAKRLARREGPFIEIYMTENAFMRSAEDVMVRIEDDYNETMMTLSDAITNLKNRTHYDAEVVFKGWN